MPGGQIRLAVYEEALTSGMMTVLPTVMVNRSSVSLMATMTADWSVSESRLMYCSIDELSPGKI